MTPQNMTIVSDNKVERQLSVEDPALGPSILTGQLTAFCKSSSGYYNTPFWLPIDTWMYAVYLKTGRHTHIHQ